ncbi:hypothetical protein BSNK01_15430 [Bacillaceae bacterium]
MLENDGINSEHITLERSAQMRYIGQSYEVTTPVPNGEALEKGLPYFLSKETHTPECIQPVKKKRPSRWTGKLEG